MCEVCTTALVHASYKVHGIGDGGDLAGRGRGDARGAPNEDVPNDNGQHTIYARVGGERWI